MKVTTVLGQEREATRFYADGSFDCPWCSYAVIAPATQCTNPWCDANPAWNPETLRLEQQKRADLKTEEDRRNATRRSVAAAHALRMEEARTLEDAQIAEARARGACLHCLFAGGRVRFIKHRKPCAKVRGIAGR